MKKTLLSFLFLWGILTINAQTCSEYMETIKSNYTGTTYYSYNSTAISQVTFYDVTIDYNSYYFAIVRFKTSYSYKEYLYQVASNTKLNYIMNYTSSAGKAFNKYIKPYNANLNCDPN